MYLGIVGSHPIERAANSIVRAFDPAEMRLPPGIPKEVRNVNTFRDLGNGKTEMIVTEYSYTSDQAHDLSKAGLEQGLDEMDGIFAK